MNNGKGGLNGSNRIRDVSAYCKGNKKKGLSRKEPGATLPPLIQYFKEILKKQETPKTIIGR